MTNTIYAAAEILGQAILVNYERQQNSAISARRAEDAIKTWALEDRRKLVAAAKLPARSSLRYEIKLEAYMIRVKPRRGQVATLDLDDGLASALGANAITHEVWFDAAGNAHLNVQLEQHATQLKAAFPRGLS